MHPHMWDGFVDELEKVAWRPAGIGRGVKAVERGVQRGLPGPRVHSNPYLGKRIRGKFRVMMTKGDNREWSFLLRGNRIAPARTSPLRGSGRRRGAARKGYGPAPVSEMKKLFPSGARSS
jgi:hypothetical protein